jgi:hypothetical protein
MDRTLREFCDRADFLQSTLNKSDPVACKKILELMADHVHQLQSVAMKFAKIYNIWFTKLKNHNTSNLEYDHSANPNLNLPTTKTAPITNKVNINPATKYPGVSRPSENPLALNIKSKVMPDPEDHVGQYEKITDHSPKKLVAPGIYLNVTEVDTIDDIPNTYLYWVKNTRQFACKIQNTVFRGHIGNIYTKPRITQMQNVHACKNKKCDMVRCRYYHDPELFDYNALNPQPESNPQSSDKKSESKSQSPDSKPVNQPIPTKLPVKNFVASEWIYSSEFTTNSNRHMRHVGSRNTLASDLDIMKMEGDESHKKYKTQFAHDMLVAIAMERVFN